ncbi:MAG: type I restriction endonuclease [Nitrospinota bacterium]
MTQMLSELLSRLREDRALFLVSEEATRQGAVLPILSAMGWDTYNIREVVPEFQVGNGRVDYCLKIGTKNSVFIEVKRTAEDLEKHQKQLLEYAFQIGIEIAILTNGLSWWLYLPLIEGSWEQRKFFVIDIEQQDINGSAQHFTELLSKANIADGTSIKKAREIHTSNAKDRIIDQTIRRAWQQLCEEPDEMLMKVFADKIESICGHRPNEETLANFLSKSLTSQSELPKPIQSPSRRRSEHTKELPPSINDIRYTHTRPLSFTFMGHKKQVSSYKEILMGISEALYRNHKENFDVVFNLKGRKRDYFSKDPDNMKFPQRILDTRIYVETNLSANAIMERCFDLLRLFNYSRDDLQVDRQPLQ